MEKMVVRFEKMMVRFEKLVVCFKKEVAALGNQLSLKDDMARLNAKKGHKSEDSYPFGASDMVGGALIDCGA